MADLHTRRRSVYEHTIDKSRAVVASELEFNVMIGLLLYQDSRALDSANLFLVTSGPAGLASSSYSRPAGLASSSYSRPAGLAERSVGRVMVTHWPGKRSPPPFSLLRPILSARGSATVHWLLSTTARTPPLPLGARALVVWKE